MVNQENKLKKQLQEQEAHVARLSNRVIQLSDELVSLKGEVDTFKQGVTQDLKRMVNLLKNK